MLLKSTKTVLQKLEKPQKFIFKNIRYLQNTKEK